MTEPLIKLPSMIEDELRAEIADQKAQLADQQAQLADQQAQLADKEVEIADKDAEIQRLQQLVALLSADK